MKVVDTREAMDKLTIPKPPTAPFTRWEGVALFGLLLLAFLLRVWRLTAVPPGLHYDEAIDLKLSQDIAAGNWMIYSPEGWGRETLYYYLVAAMLQLVPYNPLALRLAAVVCGLGLLLATYFLVRRWHSPLAAWLTIAWLAVTYWPLSASRFGVRHISLPLLLSLAVLAFWWAWDTPSRDGRFNQLNQRYTLAGVLLGLTFYTYQPARFLPALLLGFALYLCLWQREAWRARQRPFLLYLGTALLITLPLLLALQTGLGQEAAEREFTLEPLNQLLAGHPGPVWDNLQATLKLFTVAGDPLESYNLPGRPIFLPAWTGLPFYLGLALAIYRAWPVRSAPARWRQPIYAFVLLWLLVMLLPTVLTLSAPNFNRIVAAQVPIFFLAALPLAEVGSWLEAAMRHQRPFFPERAGRWGWLVAGVLAAGCLSVTAVYTYQDYFFRWPATPGTEEPLNRNIVALADYLEHDPDTRPAVVSSDHLEDSGPYIVRVSLDRTDFPLRWVDTAQAMAFPTGAAEVRLVLAADRWVDPALSDFVNIPARPFLSRDTFAVFTITPPPWPIGGPDVYGLPPDSPWPAADALPRLPGDYPYRFCGCRPADNGLIDLQAVILPPNPPQPGETLTILTLWQTQSPAQSASLSTFLHLVNSQGEIITQQDGLGYPPHTWEIGDRFVQLYHLPLPTDLPADTYWLQLGLYRRETGTRWITTPTPADRLIIQLHLPQ